MPRKRKTTPEDFTKKKKRVGKGKKPAENETRLNFRSGSIVIPSQLLRKNADQPTTHRGLGLEALLTQLKHTSYSTRVNALHGLRDLLSNNPQLLPLNLAKLVEQVLVAVCDESTRVRHALCILIGLIVAKSPAEKLLPFSSLIAAHLSCGLTHIDEKMQIDALKVLDHFLNKPLILVSRAKTILPLLVKLISRQKANSEANLSNSSFVKGKLSTGKISTLASNPDSKLADHSTIMQVLTQISKLLEAVYNVQNTDDIKSGTKMSQNAPTIDTVNKSVLIPKDFSGTHLVDFSTPVPHVPIFRYSGVYFCNLSHDVRASGDSKGSVFSYSELQLIMSILSDLLIDCSARYRFDPSKDMKNAFFLIKLIFQLLITLLRFADVTSLDSTDPSRSSFTVFVAKFCIDFQAHSLSRFPMVSQPDFSSFGTVLDFYICLVTVKLLEKVHADAQNTKKALDSIITYLSSLSSVNLDTLQSSQSFHACIEILVQVYPFLLSYSDPFVHDLLPLVTVGMARLFLACHNLSKSRVLFHKCFGELLNLPLKASVQAMVMSELLLPWLRSLPELVGDCEEVELVTLVLDALVEGVKSVRTVEVVEQVESIVTALFKHVSTVARLPVSTLRKVGGLVWGLPAQRFFQNEGLVAVTRAIQSGRVDCHVAVYLMQTIHHKFLSQCCAAVQKEVAGQYLSSMLSIIIGHSSQMLANLNQESSTSNSSTAPLFTLLHLDTSLEYQRYHTKIVRAVCECLCVSPVATQVLHILGPVLLGLSEVTLCLPVETVTGLLVLGKTLIPISSSPITENLSLFFARLCLSILVTVETTSDLNTQYPSASKLTNEILDCFGSILNSLLSELPRQLAVEQQQSVGSSCVNVTAILRSAVWLVSSGLVMRAKGAVNCIQCLVEQAMTGQTDTEVNHLVTQLQMMHSNLTIQNSASRVI